MSDTFGEKVGRILNSKTRLAIYALCGSLGTLLVYRGVVTQSEVAMYGAILAQLFGVLLAILHIEDKGVSPPV